jgi:pimeloyl-ACP methyl ester carboxylesterase
MAVQVFVAGGTGVLGRRLVPQLVARGHQVTATTRNSGKLSLLEQLGADGVVMDGLDARSVGAAALHVTYLPDSCPVWPAPKAPADQRAATRSTIPTLLFSGSFDAITPTSWAGIAARALPKSTVLDFAGIGHGVTFASDCAQQVFATFLATPSAPNTACVAAVGPPTFTPAPKAHTGSGG